MRIWIAIAAGAGAIGAGVLVGIAVAGPGGIGKPRETATPVVGKPVTAVAARDTRARGRRRSPTIDFFYSRTPIVPENGEGFVQPIRCPRGAGNPIGGGARTAEGIVIAYLSRAHPVTGRTPDRTYFVGVEDVDGGDPDPNAGAGALTEVQCAKGLRVKR
jgi:hypothetical protein